MKAGTLTHNDAAKYMNLGMQSYLFPHYRAFRNKTLEIADIRPEYLVLDFGCGIGLLEKYIINQLSAKGKVFGVDIGPALIDIAKQSYRNNMNAEFHLIAPSGTLPFADNYFDLVVTNLVTHLLDTRQKITIFKEFFRVLKPGGRSVLAEHGKPYNMFGKWKKYFMLNIAARFWPYENNCMDNYKGMLPEYLGNAGFKNVEIVYQMNGVFDFIRCIK